MTSHAPQHDTSLRRDRSAGEPRMHARRETKGPGEVQGRWRQHNLRTMMGRSQNTSNSTTEWCPKTRVIVLRCLVATRRGESTRRPRCRSKHTRNLLSSTQADRTPKA
eukprot:117281-Alexandrium_andersonii.AAC.1